MKYKKMMEEAFSEVFTRYCAINKVPDAAKEKLANPLRQFFELGALYFADDERFPFSVGLCNKCGYPVFHGEARVFTADDKNVHVECVHPSAEIAQLKARIAELEAANVNGATVTLDFATMKRHRPTIVINPILFEDDEEEI